MNYEDHPSIGANDVYQDRAAERRRTVGSDCVKHEPAAEAASVHRYDTSAILVMETRTKT